METVDALMETVDAFRLGYNYERQGKGFLDNPFPDGSTEFRRYVDGYVKSMQDRRVDNGGDNI